MRSRFITRVSFLIWPACWKDNRDREEGRCPPLYRCIMKTIVRRTRHCGCSSGDDLCPRRDRRLLRPEARIVSGPEVIRPRSTLLQTKHPASCRYWRSEGGSKTIPSNLKEQMDRLAALLHCTVVQIHHPGRIRTHPAQSGCRSTMWCRIPSWIGRR